MKMNHEPTNYEKTKKNHPDYARPVKASDKNEARHLGLNGKGLEKSSKGEALK